MTFRYICVKETEMELIMTTGSGAKYSINLSFSPIKLPPVTDILVLAKKYPQGKIGVSEAFKLIAPDEFEMISIDDNDDEATRP